MLITIDLTGDDETVVDGGTAKKDELEAVRKEEAQKAAWLEWIRHNQQVVPQVVPVTQK